MQKIINVHCHLLNFEFIPDSFFRTRAFVREWMLRHRLTRWLARIITPILPGKKYNRLHQMLAILKKDINHVAENLASEMEEANIALSTPLMMDIELAAFSQKPEIPYRYQAKMVSDIAAEYPGQIMPFIMFDPRRRSSSKLVKTALEEMGFLGVKMYPPLGYHPDPSSFFNADEVNGELKAVYGYCEKNSVPITTHCSKGGAYSGDLIHCRELALRFCNPSSWEGVLRKYPKLYLNFAHFGGDEEFMEIDNPQSWSNKIMELMKRYTHVYADISYHDKALKRKTSEAYFNVFRNIMDGNTAKNRVLFGTDWLMTRHTWKEKEYVKAFESLPPPMLQQIAFENPLDFLFAGKRLPGRIKKFYRSRNITDFPQWMKDNLRV